MPTSECQTCEMDSDSAPQKGTDQLADPDALIECGMGAPGRAALSQLDQRWRELEDLIDRTPGIDPWCSGPDWMLPVNDAFAPESSITVIDDDASGCALLARYDDLEHRGVISGLEPLWGFGCPVIGPDPAAVARRMATELAKRDDWDRLTLPGIGGDGQMLRQIGMALLDLGNVGVAEGIIRQLADLDGADTWLARRPRNFRRNLRNALRRADDAGLVIEPLPYDDTTFGRILDIEQRGWKGKEETGITSPSMMAFYDVMLRRLAARGRLRIYVALLDGVDVGFIVGGIRGATYRGLQLSYVEEVAHLSVGHILQWHQIQQLCEEQVAIYDLGMDMDYKARWADRSAPSLVLVVDRT